MNVLNRICQGSDVFFFCSGCIVSIKLIADFFCSLLETIEVYCVFLLEICTSDTAHIMHTTWSLSISPIMKTVHLLTRNVQSIAQSSINTWHGIPWLQWRLPLFVALIHRGNWGITGWCVSRPWAQFFSNLCHFRFEQTNLIRPPFLNE